MLTYSCISACIEASAGIYMRTCVTVTAFLSASTYCIEGESVMIIDYHSNKSIIRIYNIIDYDNRLID